VTVFWFPSGSVLGTKLAVLSWFLSTLCYVTFIFLGYYTALVGRCWLSCTACRSQKKEGVIYTAAEAWSHAYMYFVLIQVYLFTESKVLECISQEIWKELLITRRDGKIWRTGADFFYLVQQPPLSQGFLIHEVSRSHTTTHQIR